MDIEPARALASVVIPTYNRKATLAEVLRPVQDDPATGEVIVVVDGSQDGSYELLLDWSVADPRIRPIFQENGGDGAARQRGLEEAQFDVVVVLDDDVIAGPGLISAHLQHHSDGERRLVLGYMPTRIPPTRYPGAITTMLYAEEYEAQCGKYEDDPGTLLRNFWMGNVSIDRRGALEIRFDTRLPLRRHADMDFGLRCLKAGYKARFDRSLLATHSHSRTLEQFVADARKSGADRWPLMQEYPELARTIDPSSEASGIERAVVAIVGGPLVRPLSMRVAMAAAVGAGRMELWKVETAATRILRRIEINYAFQQAQSMAQFGVA
jgi:glycosyltransferase involved in cell wall biosynthesis